MSSPDKNKPAGKPGKRNRKTEQRNHEAADRQISSMPNEEQDAEEQMGAAAEPGHVGSNGGYWIDHLPSPEGLSVSASQAVFSVVAPGLICFRTGCAWENVR